MGLDSKLIILMMLMILAGVPKIALADGPSPLHSCGEVLDSNVEVLNSPDAFFPQVITTYQDAEGKVRKVEYAFTSRGLKDYQEMFRGIPASLIPSIETLQGMVVLDAGTGEGNFVLDMRALGHTTIFGNDINLTEVQKQLPQIFFREDIRKTSFADNKFDIIYCAWSVFHAQYEAGNETFLVSTLKELRRILKPGGRVIIYADQIQSVFEAALTKVNGLKIEIFAGGRDKAVTILRKD